MKNSTQKGAAIAIAGLLISAGAGALLGANAFPRTIVKEVPVQKEIPVPNPLNAQLQTDLNAANAKIAELQNAPPKTQTETIYVDNGKLDEVMQAVFDAKGNVEFATDDLDKASISKLADRLVMANDFRSQAENITRSEAFRELNKDNSTGVKLNKDDMRSLSLDYDTVSIDFADFDKGDCDVIVPIHFKQGSDKFDANMIVRFLDGKYDHIDTDSVTKV